MFGEEIYPVALPEIASHLREPADLLAHALVEIATHRANWWSFLPQDGPTPNYLHTDNTLTALALARTGAIALARSPASGDIPALSGLVRCPAFEPIRGVQSYALIYPGAAQLSSAAVRFRDWLLPEAAAPERRFL